MNLQSFQSIWIHLACTLSLVLTIVADASGQATSKQPLRSSASPLRRPAISGKAVPSVRSESTRRSDSVSLIVFDDPPSEGKELQPIREPERMVPQTLPPPAIPGRSNSSRALPQPNAPSIHSGNRASDLGLEERWEIDSGASASSLDPSSYSCGGLGCHGCPECPWGFWHLFDPRRYELFFGSSSSSGPIHFQQAAPNATAGSSPGLMEGFQFTAPLPWIFCGWFHGQFGLRATQNYFHGSPIYEDRRDQLFLTAGLFRRVDYGLQGGVAIDTLEENWYIGATLVQLRGELSFRCNPCLELGFQFSNHLNSDTSLEHVTGSTPQTAVASTFSSIDSYRFFYRRQTGERGRSHIQGSIGFTDDSRTLLEGSASFPISCSLGLRCSTTYLIPSAKRVPTWENEAWNLGIELVWTPRRMFGCGPKYERPLFSVADNGSFLIDRR